MTTPPCQPPAKLQPQMNEFDGPSQDVAWMADFAAVDQDFVVVRRFEALRRYELVHLQAQLMAATTELNKQLLKTDTKEPDFVAARELVQRASPLLRAHAQAVNDYEQLRSIQETPPYVLRMLQRNADGQHGYLDRQYIPGGGWHELISLGAKAKGGIYKMWQDCDWLIRYVVPRKHVVLRQVGIFIYDDNWMRRVEDFVVTVLFLAAIAGPCTIMLTDNSKHKLVVMGVSMCSMLFLARFLSDRVQQNLYTFLMSYAAFLVAISSNDNFIKG